MQINPPKSTKSKANLDDPWTMAIYFPKGLIAAFIVFVTPLWALGMLIHGHILPALAIVVTTAVLAYWCFVFVRSGARWAAYGTMLGIIICASLINSWVP